MRALLQRVNKAGVTVDGTVVGSIKGGLCIFLGVGPDDTGEVAQQLARKCAELRIFSDEAGKMNLSLVDVNGAALVVSQFTLFADARRGRRPSYTGAAAPELAAPLVEEFAAALRDLGVA